MGTLHNAPDPEGLATAREIQKKLHPSEIILGGSRAVGDHCPDSDVDLMAMAPDEAANQRTEEMLRDLLEGKQDVPVVNVTAITREEFRRTAPLAQSFAGQAARHGVTPDGSSLDYRPEKEPAPEEIRELTLFWPSMAEGHPEIVSYMTRHGEPCHPECFGREIQWGLERSFKGLLAADNDTVRFRRDAALMWTHVESTRPIADREGAQAMEDLLAATTGPEGPGCSLTAFSEAYRRHEAAPELNEPEWEAVQRCLAPALDALITEALARSGTTREDLRRERRGGGEPGLPRTSNPDSATESTTTAAISVNSPNSRPTAQHDTHQVKSDTGGPRRPDF